MQFYQCLIKTIAIYNKILLMGISPLKNTKIINKFKKTIKNKNNNENNNGYSNEFMQNQNYNSLMYLLCPKSG